MPFAVTKVARPEDSHDDDVECCIVMDNVLYTGSDDGSIKAWTMELELITTWPAHSYVVYDLATDPANHVLYSCSMDGEIKMWSVATPSSPHLLATAIQTGPTGAGADLGGMGGAASLEHEPVNVRKLLFRQGVLWAGDEMGSVCQWSANLSSCNLKKEYYTEIWSMLVSHDNNTVYTARDNEIIVADISSVSCNNPNVVLVNYTLPGRAPVVMDSEEELLVSPSRGGMDLVVRRRDNGGDKFLDCQILKKHDMIVNSLLIDGDTLVSAGWDSRVVFWSFDGQQYQHKEDVKLDSYVNIMCSTSDQTYFVGGKRGYIAQLKRM